MLARISFALLFVIASAAQVSAQVVRFETTVGSFDMVLNPTNNTKLQGHVDNLVAYVEDSRYNGSWINRADTGFVLQMGGFFSNTLRAPLTIDSTRSVQTFAPIQGEPASENPGLSNTVGTVAMALPGGAGGTNQNGGTSSFFVNLTSNTFLDADFTVFAAISDMTVVNQIMALQKIDRTTEPNFGAGSGNLAFSDVPISNGKQVFIKRAFVIEDAMSVARARAGVQSAMALSAATFANGGGSGGPSPFLPTASTTVPEPTSAFLALIGACGFGLFASRRRR
jgi:cyclophilin family peptidyl-prolyl cis-trans isomerase